MKNDLSCDVVKDLLPSYIEGLTSADSNQAVKEHMFRCEGCRELYSSMCPDEDEKAGETIKELDYLKSIKKKNRKKLRTAVLVTAGVLVLAFALTIFSSLFLVGDSNLTYHHWPSVSVNDGMMHLEFHNPNSGLSYAHWNTKYTGYGDPEGSGIGTIDITVRQVTSSPFFPSGDHSMDLSLDNIERVSFMGRTIWESGLIISQEAEQIWLRNCKFVGNAVQIRHMFDALKMPDADFTISIQSDQEPYGLSVDFKEPLNSEGKLLMVQNAPIILALIDNLEEFSFNYPDAQGALVTHSFSVADAEKLLPELYEGYNQSHGTDWELLNSIKDYSSSVYTIQQLLKVLDY